MKYIYIYIYIYIYTPYIRTCELLCYRNNTGQDEDYTSGPYSVTFTAGMTTALLSVPTNDDDIFEDSETFRLMIDSTSLPNDVTLGSSIRRSAIMTILDDEGK